MENTIEMFKGIVTVLFWILLGTFTSYMIYAVIGTWVNSHENQKSQKSRREFEEVIMKAIMEAEENQGNDKDE